MVLKRADVCEKKNISLLLEFEKFLFRLWLAGVFSQCNLIFQEKEILVLKEYFTPQKSLSSFTHVHVLTNP